MSTRAQIRFATREAGQSFNEHPDKIHAQFYCHSDGYPEGLGLDKDTWISIFEMMDCGDHVGECIFVGTPEKLIEKYSQTKND